MVLYWRRLPVILDTSYALFCFLCQISRTFHTLKSELSQRQDHKKMKIKPFQLERFYTLYEFNTEYSLCNSDSEAMSIRDLLALEEGGSEKFQDHWLGYTDTKGALDLRKEITAIYEQVKVDDLLVCSGAQEPIFLFSQAILEPEDEVIVQFPCYQSMHSIPESIGCKVFNWKVQYEGDEPRFNLEDLKAMITNKTKAIYLNTPHNPTGFHFTKEEQLEIVNLARERGIFIFSDEVYRELEHEEKYLIPGIVDVYENGVSLGVMSKSYGLPGLRIGWLACRNPKVLEKVAILKEYTTICNAGPSEFLAGLALRNRKKLLSRNLAIIKENLPLLDRFFAKHSHLFSWYRPHAGPIAWVKMNFEESNPGFVERVIHEKKVLLLPGEIYDQSGFFRIGFGRKKMPEALVQFEEFVVDNLL